VSPELPEDGAEVRSAEVHAIHLADIEASINDCLGDSSYRKVAKRIAPGNLIKIGLYQFYRFTKDVFHDFAP